MSLAIKKPCGYPGCKSVCSRRYCDVHAKQMSQQYESERADDPFRRQYHTQAWRPITRDIVLARDPICMECHAAASTEVDHIIPAREYAGDFYDPDNLQGLCKPCHSAKTAREGGFAGNNRE
jgi:5-methylcytosine-specific restriction protein A